MRIYGIIIILFLTCNVFAQIQGTGPNNKGNVPLHNLRHANGVDYVIYSDSVGKAYWQKKDSTYWRARVDTIVGGKLRVSDKIIKFNDQLEDPYSIVSSYTQMQGLYVRGALCIFCNQTDLILEINSVDGFLIPRGGTLQRPIEYEDGLLRFNTDTKKFEGANGYDWLEFTGSIAPNTLGSHTPTQRVGFNGVSEQSFSVISTGAIKIPTGVTRQRPPVLVEGLMRFNRSTRSYEYYTGEKWRRVATNTLPFVFTIGSPGVKNGVEVNNPRFALEIRDFGSMKIPSGSTAQRNVVAEEGTIRFNNTTKRLEGYDGTNWISF